MTRALLFLHGKGNDKNAHHEFCVKLAQKYEAELYSVDAPYPYKNGFSWFDKVIIDNQQVGDIKTFENSLKYLEDYISTISTTVDKMIICGHSQGGCMAVALGLRLSFLRVISICGDWPFEISTSIKQKTQDILWIEGANDTLLNEYRKNSYKKLLAAGVIINYKKANISHSDIDEVLIEEKYL